jgi:predicted transposase YdaD
MWEQSPEPLLQDLELLPLAPLCASDDSTQLLRRVATEVDKIEETAQRQEISSCTQILAGLRFKQNVIRNLFREEIMRESVIYQDIIQKGRAEGRAEARQEEFLLIIRLLTRQIGTLDPELLERIRKLSFSEWADLGEALLDFSDISDLVAWLEEHQGT